MYLVEIQGALRVVGSQGRVRPDITRGPEDRRAAPLERGAAHRHQLVRVTVDGTGDLGHKPAHLGQRHRLANRGIDRAEVGDTELRLIKNVPAQHVRVVADGVTGTRHGVGEHRLKSLGEKRATLGGVSDQVGVSARVFALDTGGGVRHQHVKTPEVEDDPDVVLGRQGDRVGHAGQDIGVEARDGTAGGGGKLRRATAIGEDPPAHGVDAAGLERGEHCIGGGVGVGVLAPLLDGGEVGTVATILPGHVDASQEPAATLRGYQVALGDGACAAAGGGYGCGWNTGCWREGEEQAQGKCAKG